MNEMNVQNSTKGKKSALKDLIYIAMFTALIVVCSKISVPLGPVPFTLQTMGVFITAAMLGWKRGTISVILYIVMGLVGIPVFSQSSGFSGGMGALASPTFGYIIGFILTALVVGLSEKFFGKKIIPLIISMALGEILCYVIGTIWFMFIYNMRGESMDVLTALQLCVFMFIIPDICKIAVSSIIVNRLDKIVKL